MEFKRLLRSSGLNLKPVEISYLCQKCGDASGQVCRPPPHQRRSYPSAIVAVAVPKANPEALASPTTCSSDSVLNVSGKTLLLCNRLLIGDIEEWV